MSRQLGGIIIITTLSLSLTDNRRERSTAATSGSRTNLAENWASTAQVVIGVRTSLICSHNRKWDKQWVCACNCTTLGNCPHYCQRAVNIHLTPSHTGEGKLADKKLWTGAPSRSWQLHNPLPKKEGAKKLASRLQLWKSIVKKKKKKKQASSNYDSQWASQCWCLMD